MNKLRLLLTENCNRDCDGCCNKQWDLSKLPVCADYSPYDLVMLTGGEPMLRPLDIVSAIINMRTTLKKSAEVILYTAHVRKPLEVMGVLHYLDGLTVTLHEQSDVQPFNDLALMIMLAGLNHTRSLRLNIFKGVRFCDLTGWQFKGEIEWIKDCPLPEDEEFMRYAS